MEKVYRAFFLLTASVVVMTGCVRNTIDDTLPAEIEGLNVPATFNWSSLVEPTLTVIPEDAYDGLYYYLVEVFDGNPVIDSTAVLLAKGVAKKDHPFETTLTKPTRSSVLYVRQTDPRRLVTVQTVEAVGQEFVCDFSDTTTVVEEPEEVMERKPLSVQLRVLENSTPSGATPLTTNLNTDRTLSGNTSYVIPVGYTYTGKLTFSELSKLYVEGELVVGDDDVPQLAASNEIVVQPGGRLAIQGSTTGLNSYSGTIFNYGSMLAPSITFNSTAKLVNKGTLDVVGTMTFTDWGNTFTNDGNASIGQVSITNGSVVNNGVMTVNGLLYTNSATLRNTNHLQAGQATTVQSTWTNQCGIYITGVLLDESGTSFDMKNGTILKVGTFNGSGSQVKLQSNAMMVATTAIFNGYQTTINGTGSLYALCKFGRVIPGNGSYLAVRYRNRVEIECSDHYQGTFWTPFYLADYRVRWAAAGKATTTIPATSCNDEGNIVTPPYLTPENPGFPLLVPTTSVYTFIMEDNWPAVADYDMNDLVVNFSLSYVQNSTNQVTGMTINYTLRAVGAKKPIAAAVQLDEILPGQVNAVMYGSTSMLTGKIFPREQAGYENGQSKVVIPLFDDAHKTLNSNYTPFALLNTYKDAEKFAPVSNSVTVSFRQAMSFSSVSIMKLNFFIVPDGKPDAITRTEIHLSGFAPTDKADNTRFGKYMDNSVKGAWYTTPGNLVWGILVPSDFKYSTETTSIIRAYPDFAAWCTSGGAEKTSWYKNPSNDATLIY